MLRWWDHRLTHVVGTHYGNRGHIRLSTSLHLFASRTTTPGAMPVASIAIGQVFRLPICSISALARTVSAAFQRTPLVPRRTSRPTCVLNGISA